MVVRELASLVSLPKINLFGKWKISNDQILKIEYNFKGKLFSRKMKIIFVSKAYLDVELLDTKFELPYRRDVKHIQSKLIFVDFNSRIFLTFFAFISDTNSSRNLTFYFSSSSSTNYSMLI